MRPTAAHRPTPPPGAGAPRRVALLGVGSLALLVAGCAADPATPSGGGTAGTTATTGAGEPTEPSRPLGHIHGVARDPDTGDVVLATHAGLFRIEAAGPTPVGPDVDLMGFAISPDGSYLGSGHPGPGSDLGQPVGLIRSTDRGRTWTTLSRSGESDFHGLTAGDGLVAGFDGALRVSADGRSWRTVAIPAEPHVLAASPAGDRLLATTPDGLLASADGGGTWSLVPTPELLVAVDWADADTVVGVSTTGSLLVSEDRAAGWTAGPRPLGQVTSLHAYRSDGVLGVLAVVEGGVVVETTDLGASSTRLL